MEVGSAIRGRAIAVRDRAARARSARAGTIDGLIAAALAQARLATEPYDFGEGGRAAGTLAVLVPGRTLTSAHLGEDGRAAGATSTRAPGKILTSVDLDGPGWRFAVAHELGHHHLHDDERLIDGFGQRPVVRDGCVFVDGYSYRSSKEVQADLFAWEFLCPSASLLRKLAAGDEPERIAAELGLPPDLVRGQAVNALLRTAGTMHGRRCVRRRRLDPEQRACVDRRAGASLVVGGPGTGKTTVLLEQARRALHGGARPSSLLVVAATRSAAERHHASLSARRPALAGHAFFGTFEDLAHEIVARWPHGAGRTGEFVMLDRVAALHLSRSDMILGRRGGQAGGLRAIDAARLAAGGGHDDDAADLARAHDRALAEADKVDGGGLIALAIEVLEAHPNAVRCLGLRFEHVLVDDLQDAPPAAVTLLSLFAREASVIAAADPAQALDGFRGRTGAAVDAFRTTFSPVVHTLARNHRSSAPVASVAEALRTGRIGSMARTAPSVTFEGFADPRAEALAVARRVSDLRRRGVPLRAQAVLTWANEDLDAVADALQGEEVPIVHLGDLRTRREVGDVLSFLRFALEPTDAHLAAAAAAAGLTLPPADACETLVATALWDASDERAPERPTRPADVSGTAWTRLAEHANLVRRGPLAARLVDWLCGPHGSLVPLLRDTRPPEARMALVAMHHLLHVCREHEAMRGAGIGDLEKRLRHARSLDQRTRFREVSTTMPDVDAVELLTIRASRGREFEVVHALGLHAKPRKAGRGGGTDERANLTVALSRARDRLHASWSAEVDGRATRPLEPLGELVGLPRLADARRGARSREAAGRR